MALEDTKQLSFPKTFSMVVPYDHDARCEQCLNEPTNPNSDWPFSSFQHFYPQCDCCTIGFICWTFFLNCSSLSAAVLHAMQWSTLHSELEALAQSCWGNPERFLHWWWACRLTVHPPHSPESHAKLWIWHFLSALSAEPKCLWEVLQNLSAVVGERELRIERQADSGLVPLMSPWPLCTDYLMTACHMGWLKNAFFLQTGSVACYSWTLLINIVFHLLKIFYRPKEKLACSCILQIIILLLFFFLLYFSIFNNSLTLHLPTVVQKTGPEFSPQLNFTFHPEVSFGVNSLPNCFEWG